jgi:hypothetical protein
MFDIQGRVNEEYILWNYEQTTFSEYYTDHKERLEQVKQLVRGDWADLYPDGTDMPGSPLIENAAKSSLRDISGLAADASPTPNFIAEGETQTDYTKSQVRENIAKTLWEVNNGPRIERKLYMDAIYAGFIAVACAPPKSKMMPYASLTRLRPDRVWPEVRNGNLNSLLYIERVKIREAAKMYPEAFGEVTGTNDETCQLVDYYDSDVVVRAIVITVNGLVSQKNRESSVAIVEEWKHGLGCIPVAFVQVDSIDEAFRGLLDQVAPGLLSRNRIFQYLMDYMYDMVHASFEEKNIRNWSDPPGPDTIYHHDPSDPNSFMRRVAPAAPAPAVFGIAQYMDGQTSGEAIQPPSRQGDVRQSIASASFVAATQGRLTTVIKDLHQLMSDLRQQLTYILFKIEEEHVNVKKPLYFPVGNKNTYTPDKDINDWYHCKYTFGVAAGQDRMTADQRLVTHKGAGAISMQTYRDQLEYIDDPTLEQQKIDREDTQNAFKQRLLMDPRMPLAVVAKVSAMLDSGKSLVEVAEQVVPELQAADEAAQQGQTPAGPGGEQPATPGQGGAQPPTNGPLAAGPQQPTAGQAAPDVQLPESPMVQQFITNGGA